MTEIESATDAPSLSLTVSEADSATRLDAYLASHINGWSRARLQRLIEAGDVLVNSKVCKASYKVSATDEIEIELTAPPESNFTPENIPLDVVFEDDHIIVVNKPPGLVVHPAAGIQSGTLANALAFHFQQLSNSASI